MNPLRMLRSPDGFRRSSWCPGLCMLILFLSSCHTDTPDNRQVFRYNEDGPLTSLDPAFARTQGNTWIIQQLFNGLVQLDAGMQVQPCIARSWTIDETHTVYTFYLRNDVHFHTDDYCQGRKVTAHDFLYSFSRILDKSLASPGAWVFGVVLKDSTGAPVGFEAPNDSVFIIRLKKPFSPFLPLLTQSYCSVVPHESVEHWGKEFRNHPVGTGPFQFFLWDEGIKLILHKNPSYFETDSNGICLPYLDAVSVSFMDNKLAAFLAFTKGELDFFNGLESNYKDEILQKNGLLKPAYAQRFELQTVPYLNTEYLGFLVDDTSAFARSSVVSNRDFRKAMSYAVNREELVTYLRNNIGTPATAGFTPAGFPMLDAKKIQGYTYNPDSAACYMKAAGLAGKTIELPLYTTQQYLDIAVLLQNQLSKIGVKIKIEVNQSSFNRALINKGKALFFRASWIADYPDPENFMGLFYSRNYCPDGPNYTHIKNNDYDALYEKTVAETNDSLKYAYVASMEKIILGEAPVITLFYDKTFRLLQKNISGLQPNVLNIPVLKYVRKK